MVGDIILFGYCSFYIAVVILAICTMFKHEHRWKESDHKEPNPLYLRWRTLGDDDGLSRRECMVCGKKEVAQIVALTDSRGVHSLMCVWINATPKNWGVQPPPIAENNHESAR